MVMFKKMPALCTSDVIQRGCCIAREVSRRQFLKNVSALGAAVIGGDLLRVVTRGPSQSWAATSQTSHTLAASPKTVHWGHYDSRIAPVLRINPGDVVTITSVHGPAPVPASLYAAGGIPSEQIPQALKDIEREVKDKGPGPHILTGPIYIDGAEPGDILEVHIKDIKLTAPFGYNLNWPGKGTIPEDFPYTALRILRMNLQKMTSEVAPGVVIPLRPFYGSMGVAPPAIMGKFSSVPPGIHGGNLDIKEFVAGTILYLPVHIKGALFSVGDMHAVQGDGEVNLTAIEATETIGTFQLFVRKGKRLVWPRGETPTHIITVGFDEDLDIAAKMAVRETINYLHEEKGVSRENAYMLCSIAVDLHIAQLVNGVKGIYAMLPKNIFVKK